ncbi:hypothetical protein RJ641_036674 [Dillenia turbinata]|uniref:Uncharacterized protein n=1 Tax=Dillenia turbinata TaxID=194707 RepID=A0AAN8ZGP8_9MAGN
MQFQFRTQILSSETSKGNQNTPISLDLKSIKHKDAEIRTNPPSPQCFSVTQEPMKTTPSRVGKSRLKERGILQELKQGDEEVISINNINGRRSASNLDARERRALDVFWLLKPCTLSSQTD